MKPSTAQIALEALQTALAYARKSLPGDDERSIEDAIAALEADLAAKVEPVAVVTCNEIKRLKCEIEYANYAIEKLIAERDAMRADAERHRFSVEKMSPVQMLHAWSEADGKPGIDATIDAARSAS